MNLINKQSVGRFAFGLLLALVVIILAGCCTPEQIVVTKTVTKVIQTPSTLLIKCKATPPPAKDSFAALSEKDIKIELTKLSNQLYGDIESCNGQIRSIADFQTNELKSAEEANKEASKK